MTPIDFAVSKSKVKVTVTLNVKMLSFSWKPLIIPNIFSQMAGKGADVSFDISYFLFLGLNVLECLNAKSKSIS